MSAEQNVFQRVAEATGGVVTPANAMDAAAFAVTVASARQLDSPSGIARIGGAFTCDYLDGKVARGTGTVSDLGAGMDAIGDKVKIGIIGYQAHKKGMTNPLALGAVVAQNAINAGTTIYDRLVHDEPQVKVTFAGRATMFGNCLGLGVQIIGTELSKTHPEAGRKMRKAGGGMVAATLAVFGWRATREYLQAAGSAPDRSALEGLRQMLPFIKSNSN